MILEIIIIFFSIFFYKSNNVDQKCFNIWSEKLPLISCKEYSHHSIHNYSSIKLYYACCETFSSENCINSNYTSNFDSDLESDDYHKHSHPIINYVLMYDYYFLDYFFHNIYLYKMTCYCTPYLIDYPCKYGTTYLNQIKYYPVNSRSDGYIMLDTTQKFYMMLNYLIKNNYYVVNIILSIIK